MNVTFAASSKVKGNANIRAFLKVKRSAYERHDTHNNLPLITTMPSSEYRAKGNGRRGRWGLRCRKEVSF